MNDRPAENVFEAFRASAYSNLTTFEGFDRDSPENAESMADLLRALRRKKGFSLFFVQCAPAWHDLVVTAIQKRFPQKRLAQIELDRQSETLYWELLERYQTENFEIACITGMEQALFAYEDAKRLLGWNAEEIYDISWKDVPPLLVHLNRLRESFAENLPVALVFLIRSFAIDYLIRRAPDFFDWRSGLFKLVESSEDLQKSSQELVSKTYKEYLALTPEQRMDKIAEIKDKIFQLDSPECEHRSSLLREQGRLFESNDDPIQALGCYDRALAVNYKNYQAWYSKGLLFNDLERYEEAIESYNHALEIQPKYHFAWDERGTSLYYLQRYEEALESYDHALKIKSDYHFAWRNRGLALKNLKRYEEALESYDRALKIRTEYHLTWDDRGTSLYYLQRYEEALESYDRALKIKSDYYSAWRSRGLVLDKLKRYEEALESYDRALKIKSDYHCAWNSRGVTLCHLNRHEEAIESYNRAIEIQPNFHQAWHNRGDTLGKLEKYEEAIVNFDRALEIQPDYYYAWDHRGTALKCLKRYEEAIESYDRALEIQPDYYYAWYGRSTVLFQMNSQESAAISILKYHYYKSSSEGKWHFKLLAWAAIKITNYQLIIEQSDSKGKWHFKLLAWMFEKFNSSKILYDAIVKIQPSNFIAWNARGYLTLARWSYGLQRVFNKPLLIRQFRDCSGLQSTIEVDLECCRKALTFFDAALKLYPDFEIAWANRSFPAYYLQQYQDALQNCDRALELDPANEEEMNEVIYTNRGCIFLQLHNPTAALQDFTTALEIDPQLDEAWIGKGTALYQLSRYAEARDSFTKALALNHPLAQPNLDLLSQKEER